MHICGTGGDELKNHTYQHTIVMSYGWVINRPIEIATYLVSYGRDSTVYPKKYAHGFVVLCFVVVMQSFIMNSSEVFIHIHQGCFAGTGAIVRLPRCQRSKPDGYEKISQCITTTKHSKAKTVCIFLGIYSKSYVWIRYTAAMSYRWDIKSYVWDTYAVAKSVIIIKITSKERLAADGLS